MRWKMVVLEEGKSSRRSFIRTLTSLTAVGTVAGLLPHRSRYAFGIDHLGKKNPDSPNDDAATQSRGAPIPSASYTVSTDGSYTKAENSATGEIDYSGSDASAVISSALAALTSGGSVFIKRGSASYFLTSRISIKTDGISILGDYPQIRLADNANDDMLEVAAGQKDILVQGLDLDGNRNNNKSGRPIHVLGNSDAKPRRITVAGNRVHDFITQGIRLESSSIDCQISDNEVWNGGWDGILLMWGDHYRSKVIRNTIVDCEYGIGVSQCYNALVSHNQICNSSWAGVVLDGPSSRCVISHNIISGGLRDGLWINIGGGSSCPVECTIVGNMIENMGDNGIRITDLQNCLVAHNTILNCGYNAPNRYGILMDKAEGPTGVRDCMFLGNFVRGPNHTCAIKSVDDHYGNVFTANWLRGNIAPIDLLSTWNKCFLNEGYNSIGTPTPVSVKTSPFEYHSGMRPETVYIQGGIVSEIKIGDSVLYTSTDHSVELPPKQSVKISYYLPPSMFAQVH